MCGIVGYIGSKQAAPVILNGLERLEYRGYDSAGMAVYDNGAINVVKAKGKLRVLEELTHGGDTVTGTLGIGHTRWATHGKPNEVNAHPHCNADKSIAVVHNGIIENFAKLKERLIKNGYEFISDTDTEVVANLLDHYYKGDPLEALTKVLHRIEGSYALGVIFSDKPDKLYAARKGSPLIVGIGKGENYIASDVPAILKYTRSVVYLDDREIACLSADDAKFYTVDEEELEKEVKTIEWDADVAEKGGYDHFMLKEMHEQPQTVIDTLKGHIKGNDIILDELNMSDEELKDLSKIYIVACGSAYHVGVTGKYIFEGLDRVSVEVDLASEFRYRNPIMDEGALVIVISQSGETADSLEALREAKSRGFKVLAIVNVEGSSIAREADSVILTKAGPEIGVATTKAYTGQLIAIYLLAAKLAILKGSVERSRIDSFIEDLKRLPDQIELLMSNKQNIQRFANRYIGAQDVYFIGRGIDYAISLEGSLKLKEISYIHSEAYAAGELKHGTISLIEEGTLVASVATQPELFKKTMSNMEEVKSRGAFVLAVTIEGNTDIENEADYVIYIPETDPYLTNSLAIIPLQLFAYYVSIGKGYDPDKPRNLAKSVTVE